MPFQGPTMQCRVVNWDGPVEEFAEVEVAFFAATKSILGILKRAL
jgi:hypothetical protein